MFFCAKKAVNENLKRMNTKLDPKDPNFLSSFFDQFLTAMNGMKDDLGKLPENVQKLFGEVTEAAKAKMSALHAAAAPPAGDASKASEALAAGMASACELSNQLLAALGKMKTELSTSSLSLNSLQERITKGELIEAEAAKTATTEAVSKALKDRATLVGKRRGELLLAKLPVPENEEIITGEEAAFKTLKDDAVKRVEALGKRGLSLNSLESAGDLLYAPAAEFDRTVNLAAKLAKTEGDPMAGGGAAATNGEKPRRRLCI